MYHMIAKFSRFGGREYSVGQDCAELDPDFDSDSDEIKPDIQKPPLVAEFSCYQFTGGIDWRWVEELEQGVYPLKSKLQNIVDREA